MHVIAGIRERLGRHQTKISANHTKKIELFAALRLGHYNDAAIAARISDQRDANARIASRAFHNRTGLAGLQSAARFGIRNDAKAGAVLHGTARVHEFRLTQNVAAGHFAGALQAYQWCIADRAGQTIHDILHACHRNHRAHCLTIRRPCWPGPKGGTSFGNFLSF